MAYMSHTMAKIFYKEINNSIKNGKDPEQPVQTKGNTNHFQTYRKMSIIREVKINTEFLFFMYHINKNAKV